MVHWLSQLPQFGAFIVAKCPFILQKSTHKSHNYRLSPQYLTQVRLVLKSPLGKFPDDGIIGSRQRASVGQMRDAKTSQVVDKRLWRLKALQVAYHNAVLSMS